MIELLVGALLLVGSIALLWLCRPVGGQIRPFLQGGRDAWVVIAIVAGIGVGVIILVQGVSSLVSNQ
jgi:hypothetical protein